MMLARDLNANRVRRHLELGISIQSTDERLDRRNEVGVERIKTDFDGSTHMCLSCLQRTDYRLQPETLSSGFPVWLQTVDKRQRRLRHPPRERHSHLPRLAELGVECFLIEWRLVVEVKAARRILLVEQVLDPQERAPLVSLVTELQVRDGVRARALVVIGRHVEV